MQVFGWEKNEEFGFFYVSDLLVFMFFPSKDRNKNANCGGGCWSSVYVGLRDVIPQVTYANGWHMIDVHFCTSIMKQNAENMYSMSRGNYT